MRVAPRLLTPPGADLALWRGERANRIGASEIACVLGISPYRSPLSLYYQKLDGWSDEDSAVMRRGRLMEAVVAVEWSLLHPEFVVRPAGLYQHPEHHWMVATPDRLLYTNTGIHDDVVDAEVVCCDLHVVGDAPWLADWAPCCETFTICRRCCEDCPTCPHLTPEPQPAELWEGKTAASHEGWGEENTDEVPLHYLIQVRQQLLVTGLPRARIAVMMLPSWELREYLVERDPADDALIVAEGENFMRRLAELDPPPLDWSPSTTDALKRLHPTVDAVDVDIPADLAEPYEQACADLVAAKKRRGLYGNQIRAVLGSGRRAMCGGRRIVTRSVYEQTRIDTKALRANEPGIAKEYSKKSVVDKLIPARIPVGEDDD